MNKKFNKIRDFTSERHDIILGAIIFFGFVAILFITLRNYKPSGVIDFNFQSGFYSEDIEIELGYNGSSFGGEVRYTLDGDDPAASGIKYEDKISLKLMPNEVKVHTITAAYCVIGRCSKSISKTFVIAENTDQIGTDILSITSDHSGLYDYKRGIMVGGAVLDDSIRKGAQETCVLGNYKMRGEKWERDAHMTIIKGDGSTGIDQDIKLSIAGNASSCSNHKSFKYSALDGEKFTIDFGRNDLNSYKILTSRIGAADLSHDTEAANNIRTGVAAKLLAESGFDGYLDALPVTVYLNGEFYAIEYLQQKFTDGFIRKNFGLKNADDVEMVKLTEEQTMDRTSLRQYFMADLNDEDNRKVLEEKVDMENFLTYYAINVLWNNTDWPQNNYEIWRYNGVGEKNNKYSDGRWRFLSFDPDLIYQADLFSIKCDGDIFNYLMGNSSDQRKTVFTNVIRSDYYRNEFLNIITGLQDKTFNYENISRIVDEEASKISEQVKMHYDNEEYKKFLASVDEIKAVAKNRPVQLQDDFKKYGII